MTVWDVSSQPASEQFAYWREIICEAFVPLSPASTVAGHGFASRVETRSLDSVVRASLGSQPQTTTHGRREVARTDGDYVFVNLQTVGECGVEQAGRRSVVRPGQFTVVDTTEPYRFAFDAPWEMVSYRVPHALLSSRRDTVRDLLAGAWGADGAGAVVTGLVRAMWEVEPGPGAPDVEAALVSALCGVAGGQGAAARDPRAALRTAALRCIDRGLGDPALGVASVSRELGVAPRTLHAAVSAGGESFAALLRRRRMERAAALLAGPGAAPAVTEVAAAVGYDGPSSFSRAFRRAFGRSPSEARRDARTAREACTD
ncbi:helix-turn-helix domain-containing protein [Pseudonocardia sp. ICBG601]|uniref:helix-turn-helix domain-containing protein n=1 Tax=Pseudonocardia sp. ICBG601 TaxID=2846759 RepID=UPI0027E396D9|nr:helix-turn-helix domain-containing protein [Pseudonocardia sp. ICBG601]